MKLTSIPKQYLVLAVLLSAYYLVAFYPILDSGFYSDDIFFVEGTKGNTLFSDISIIELAKQDTESWMKNGRFAPLFYLQQRAIFYYFTDAFAYKMVLMVLNQLAVLACAAFLYLLQGSKKLVLLSLIVLPALFQFRVLHHDAYTTFNGMYQLIAIFNFAALSLFTLYLRNGKRHYLLGTLVGLVVGFCYSELTLVFVPLYLVITVLMNPAIKNRFVFVVKKLSLVAVVTAMYFALIIFMRVNQPKDHFQYVGLRTSYDAGKMLKVFHAQVFSAIPLSYINYEMNFMHVEPANMWEGMRKHAPLLGIGLLLSLYLILYTRYAATSTAMAPHSYKLFFWIGLLLLILPAVLLMPSAKYQGFSRPGNGYIPVYLQNIGAAMLFALLTHWLLTASEKFKRYIGVVLVVVFLLIVPITFANNMRVVAIQNNNVYYPSLALEKALDDGLMEAVNENDVIWLTNNYHWGATEYYMYLFFENTGKRLQVTNEVKPEGFNALGQSVFQLSFAQGTPNTVMLRKVMGFNESGEPLYDESSWKELSYTFY